jgi:hypothetical protein
MGFVHFPTNPAAVSQGFRPTTLALTVCVGFAAWQRRFQVGTFIAVRQGLASKRYPSGPIRTQGLSMTATLARPEIEDTALARLEGEGRLLNPLHKALTSKPGRVGFRGELALRFAPKLADEARPPELMCPQAMAIANVGEAYLPFFAGYLLSFEHLKDVAEVLGDALSPAGKYFLFCNNIDLSKKYQVAYQGATFYVLPIDESTVYNELLDLLYLEKNDLKKKDTAGKLDAVANAALKFSASFEAISYEQGLAVMGPVRNPNENRPV